MSNKLPPAVLKIGNKSVNLPVISGSVGPNVMDIRQLYEKTDTFTLDPGFTSTAACESSITYIDGDKGELLYRGYPIDQLANKIKLYRGLLPTVIWGTPI